MSDKQLSLEEISFMVKQHDKDINSMKVDMVDMKSDIKEIKIDGKNNSKILNKLDEEREERLKAGNKSINKGLWIIISCLITSGTTYILTQIFAK